MSPILEIACFNFESALLADKAGADRLELCVNYKEGGLTPPTELIQAVLSHVKIPVHVMIRPRAGNFIYTQNEILEMQQSIRVCKEMKVAGIVVGCLTPTNTVDKMNCEALIKSSSTLSLTFHRAIDECLDLGSAIESLIAINFDRILSSGGKQNAKEGMKNLTVLQNKFGKKIKIMPGGSIRSSNLNELITTTLCEEFHSAAITDSSGVCDPLEIMKLKACLQKFV